MLFMNGLNLSSAQNALEPAPPTFAFPLMLLSAWVIMTVDGPKSEGSITQVMALLVPMNGTPSLHWPNLEDIKFF